MGNMAREQALQREDIVARAAQLFSERGYAATSLRDIMDGFDATGPAFYYYFDSKGDILVEIIDGALDDADEALDRLIEDPELTAATRFLKAMVSHANMVWGNLTAARVLFVENGITSAKKSENIRLRMQNYAKRLSSLYEEGAAEGVLVDHNPRMVTSLIIGMANWGAFWVEDGTDREALLGLFEGLVHGAVREGGAELLNESRDF